MIFSITASDRKIYIWLMRFEFLTAARIQCTLSWDVTSRSLVDRCYRFGRTCWLHFLDNRVSIMVVNFLIMTSDHQLKECPLTWKSFFDFVSHARTYVRYELFMAVNIHIVIFCLWNSVVCFVGTTFRRNLLPSNRTIQCHKPKHYNTRLCN
jgi:hypothetical protein